MTWANAGAANQNQRDDCSDRTDNKMPLLGHARPPRVPRLGDSRLTGPTGSLAPRPNSVRGQRHSRTRAHGPELHGISICIALSKHSDPGCLLARAACRAVRPRARQPTEPRYTLAAIASESPTMLLRVTGSGSESSEDGSSPSSGTTGHYPSPDGLGEQRGVAVAGVRRSAATCSGRIAGPRATT